jgi:UDP-N-acetyl-D-glucosamine dehydrogenase
MPKTAAVIGLGYVGLPLLVELAAHGFRALGVDVDQSKIDAICKGKSYIADVPSAEVKKYRDLGLIDATTDYSRLSEADAISICVPTPLRKTKDPDLAYIVHAVESLAPHLKKGAIVILESTTYPGTTDELVLPRLETDGKKAGKDFYLAFSPERVDPGNPVYQTHNTPKVLGGFTPECTKRAAAFYGALFEKVEVVSSTRAAEMVKLLENTFRAVNIGLVNEMAVMCERLGLDVWEVIRAAASKPFGFMPFYPGPGLGGHCIPIDPLYLSWKLRSLNYTARFIELASEVNTSMPRYVVDRLMKSLNARGKAVKGARILILGVAYKRDVSDVRESPAIDAILLLQGLGAKVSYSDPYVPHLREHELDMKSVKLTPAAIKAADAVLVITDHKGIDYKSVVKSASYIFDARNALVGVKSKKIERL